MNLQTRTVDVNHSLTDLRDLLQRSPPQLNNQGATAPGYCSQPPIANFRPPNHLTLRQVISHPHLHDGLDSLVEVISASISGSSITPLIPVSSQSCSDSQEVEHQDNDPPSVPDYYHREVAKSCMKATSDLLRAYPAFEESSTGPDLPLAWRFSAEPALGKPECGVGLLEHVARRQPLVVWAFHPTAPPSVVAQITYITSNTTDGYAWRRPNLITDSEESRSHAASFLCRIPDYVTKDVITAMLPAWWVNVDLSASDPSNHPQDIVPLSSEDEQASSLIQRAWLLATLYDTTFVVISDGTSERIGIRHRESQTLVLSKPVEIASRTNYFKSQVGLYLAAYCDSMQRFRPLAPVGRSSQKALSQSVHLPIQFRGGAPEIWIKDDNNLDLLNGFKRIPFTAEPAKMLQGLHLQLYPTTTSYLPFQGALYSGEICVQERLFSVTSSGVLPCKIMRTEFSNYQMLMREGPFRPTQILQYYSLFRRNGTDATMALIMDNPGKALDAYENLLTSRQVDSFLEQLRQIHLAGFLHKRLASENLYVGEDGVSAFIIGFAHICEVDPSTEQGRMMCGWEVEYLANILWEKHDGTHEFLESIIQEEDYDNWDWGTYSQWRETLAASQVTDHLPAAVVALM